MAERELVEAYLEGRIGVWGLFRRLTKLGMATGTALAVALSMPAAVKSRDFTGLQEAKTKAEAEDRLAVDRILTLLGAQLARVPMETSLAPLSVTLARIGANNDSLLGDGNTNVETTLSSIPLNLQGDNFAFEGSLATAQGESGPNLALTIGGNVDQMALRLAGFINIPIPRPEPPGPDVNLGNVSLHFTGAVGDVPLNFRGHIGNIEMFEVIDPNTSG